MCLADLIDRNPATLDPRLGPSDNWVGVIDDARPRAIRWTEAGRWSPWHWTEGAGVFAACGEAVVLFDTEDSPAEGDREQIACPACLERMAAHGMGVPPLRAAA